MEELTSLVKTANPLSLADIVVETERDLDDYILYKVHLKYDTQATVEDVVSKLKRLDGLYYRLTEIQAEMLRTEILIDTTEECYQEPIKAYLDGLNKAWSILDGNK